jgi:hypothetical protein
MKQALASLMLALVGISLSMATNILVLTVGWGLEPKSWQAIIVLGLLGHMMAQVFVEVSRALLKDE